MATCYIVATPIGNLGDFTPRAQETLANVTTIFAEDTRVTGHLLRHFSIHTPLKSLHEHNEVARIESIVTHLDAGHSVAIVSDAGTPLISDPGYKVVTHLREKGYPVIPIPGASALITALSVSGLPTDRFLFEGFLPARSGQRQSRLSPLVDEPRTLIFYESSHRILAMLTDLVALFGAEREAFIGREMTKRFEQYLKGTLGELLTHFTTEKDEKRGEFVVIIKGADRTEEPTKSIETTELLTLLLKEGLPIKQITRIAEALTGGSKNELYQQALALKEQQSLL